MLDDRLARRQLRRRAAVAPPLRRGAQPPQLRRRRPRLELDRRRAQRGSFGLSASRGESLGVEHALEQHRAEVALAGVGQDRRRSSCRRSRAAWRAARRPPPRRRRRCRRGCPPRGQPARVARSPPRWSPARPRRRAKVEHVGHEAGADALDLVRPGLQRLAGAASGSGPGSRPARPRPRRIGLPFVFLM